MTKLVVDFRKFANAPKNEMARCPVSVNFTARVLTYAEPGARVV